MRQKGDRSSGAPWVWRLPCNDYARAPGSIPGRGVPPEGRAAGGRSPSIRQSGPAGLNRTSGRQSGECSPSPRGLGGDLLSGSVRSRMESCDHGKGADHQFRRGAYSSTSPRGGGPSRAGRGPQPRGAGAGHGPPRRSPRIGSPTSRSAGTGDRERARRSTTPRHRLRRGHARGARQHRTDAERPLGAVKGAIVGSVQGVNIAQGALRRVLHRRADGRLEVVEVPAL